MMDILAYLQTLLCPKKTQLDICILDLGEARSQLLRLQSYIRQLEGELDTVKKNYKVCVDNLSQSKADVQHKIEVLQNEKAGLEAEVVRLELLIKESESSYMRTPMSLLSTETENLLKLFWNKYNEAEISYSGRYLGTKKQKYEIDVKVFGLEGQNNRAIKKRVKDAGACISDIIMNEKVGFHKACDLAAMRVAKAFPVNYQFDDTTWGSSEFWMYASESEALRSGDCDDMMIWRYVGCRVAGIPQEMLRMAAGITFSGEGHATNYYFASDLTWRHINSTSNYSATQDVKKLAKTGELEALNLKSVWFSFTEGKTWSQLSTEAKESLGKKEAMRLMRNFSIRPKR